MPRPKVLVVEDDDLICLHLERAFRDTFDVFTAQDAPTALTCAREHAPTGILLDLGLPPKPSDPEEGLRLLREIRRLGGNPKIVVCTGYGDRKYAVRAVSYGAHDFLVKPVEAAWLKGLMQRACWLADLEQDRRALPPEAEEEIEEMIGTSEVMRRVFATIRKVASAELPVLIIGESGTGKELTAKAIHERSLRKGGPFVTINCGAIPENLLESELFGHERGAFTGATQQKKGRVEYAQGGTLFLDEIGELPLALQVKFLRFLQDQTLERVGGRQQIQVDARIIAATNVDLKEAIPRGTFREDLYYRLGVVAIALPPLRHRGDDVLIMAQVFQRRLSERMRKHVIGFTKEAIAAIQTHAWPGNVRELSNKIRRAAVMAEGPYISPEDLDLPSPAEEKAVERQSLKEARQRLEADLIVRSLMVHAGNLSRAAEELGISRPYLYDLLRKYRLRPDHRT